MKRRFAINILCIPFLVLVVLLDCSKGSEPYYPLKEGLTREYNISQEFRYRDSGGFAHNQSFTVKMLNTYLASRELKGKKVTPATNKAESYIFLYFLAEDNNGIYIFASQKPEDVEPEIVSTPTYEIKYPIQLGTTWDETSKSLLADFIVPLKIAIDKVDEVVTVAAGTFNGCVRVKKIGTIKKKCEIHQASDHIVTIEIEEYAWYASGVGLIKKIMKHTLDRTYDGDLSGLGDSFERTEQLESFKK